MYHSDFAFRSRSESRIEVARPVDNPHKIVSRLSRLFPYETAPAKNSIVHQVDKAHVTFIKRIMTGRRVGFSRLLAKLHIHGEPLLENDTPIHRTNKR